MRSGPVAQRSEQAAHNCLVVGSNPTGPTTIGINSFLIEPLVIVWIHGFIENGIRLGKKAQNTRKIDHFHTKAS